MVYYGVATISKLLKSISLFCKRALQKRRVFSKETYNCKEPTNRSHAIFNFVKQYTSVCCSILPVPAVEFCLPVSAIPCCLKNLPKVSVLLNLLQKSKVSVIVRVSLENTGLFCRALLQKRRILLRSQLIVATP